MSETQCLRVIRFNGTILISFKMKKTGKKSLIIEPKYGLFIQKCYHKMSIVNTAINRNKMFWLKMYI